MLDTTRSFLDGRALKLKDYHGNQVNISDGHRIVSNQPENYTRAVYVFGGCITFGAGCPDDGTSSACLQQLFSDNGMNEFKVENYGMFTFGRKKHVFERIKLLPYKPGDILVSSFSNLHSPKGVTYLPEGVFHVDTLRMFERPHDWGENVFFDTSHPNEIGQRAIAAKVFDFLKTQNFFEGFADSHYAVPVLSANILPREELALLDEYLSTITPLRSAIGAVVLNCNPFTLGHRYLVEQSAQKVARLFIFVVEEDKSVFSFADRIELVRQGTADIPNVTVIPSGKFIISSLTFTDYFGKSELQDRTIDPSMDVRLFGQFIAPKMGINIRFAGEEPLDNVTRQYNDAMRRILPQYGVEFEAIPRKESEGEVISASRVRKLLESKDFDAIAKIVPETTLVYLIEKFGDESDITQKPVIWRKKAGAVLSRIFSRRKQSGRPMDRHGA
jgi:[citrate (pro-3S)-lyase] ligase